MTRSLDFMYRQRRMLLPLTTDEEAEQMIGAEITKMFSEFCARHGVPDDGPPIVLVTRVDNVLGMFDVESFKRIEVSDD